MIFDRSKDKSTKYPAVTPAVDIYHAEDGYKALLDVPGVVKGDVEVSIDGDRLTISASRHLGLEESVVYRRTLALPATVDRESITASLEHGVLTLTLPKRAQAKPRQIPVKAA